MICLEYINATLGLDTGRTIEKVDVPKEFITLVETYEASRRLLPWPMPEWQHSCDKYLKKTLNGYFSPPITTNGKCLKKDCKNSYLTRGLSSGGSVKNHTLFDALCRMNVAVTDANNVGFMISLISIHLIHPKLCPRQSYLRGIDVTRSRTYRGHCMLCIPKGQIRYLKKKN